jgi:two-component system, chemotaxis family, chemotaxis protein CheY
MGTKVMVVDDSALSRRMLRRILESGGHEVLEAKDGMSALECYALERPSVVLLDLVMTGMYGLEVLTELRKLDPGARVVIATADIQSATHEEAMSAGAAGFIKKPFAEEEVLAAVSASMKDPPR